RPRPVCSWKHLDPIGRYAQLIYDQTSEVCQNYEVDGIFYDICHAGPSYSPACLAMMKERGFDPEKWEDAVAFNTLKWGEFEKNCNDIIKAKHPEATVFYNGISAISSPLELLANDTHFELEDLPTMWGGYDKFPPRAKYFERLGKKFLAMSGKFHTMWGEFGGFKHPDAIRFEAACMIAYGARCSMGDQLHPSGEADLATYRSIGAGYAYVEKIEAYGLDGHSCSNLGLFLSKQKDQAQGVANMLMETQTDFQVVDWAVDAFSLEQYEAIILPEAPGLSPAQAEALMNYVKAGGNLLLLGAAALNKDGKAFLLDLGAVYEGPGRYDVDYSVVGKELAQGLVETPFLNYSPAIRVKLTDGHALGAIHEPYFSRTYGAYCSHQNTANQLEEAGHPLGWCVRRGQGTIVCLSHSLGEIYGKFGARLHRQLFSNALGMIHQSPTLKAPLPSSGRVNLVHQPQHRRYVVHLMYGPPLQRGRCMVIEDLVPIRDVEVELRVPQLITQVTIAPHDPAQRRESKPALVDGAVKLTVPQVKGHQMVVFAY
ncbi:MAG: hypothetical protein HQL31_11755, partial [Planctomycetes bacterium]|nr:hypothetical protein [Planctomycetota bacterium]